MSAAGIAFGVELVNDSAPRLPALRIHASDNVAVATQPLSRGQLLTVDGISITVARDVSLGAKLALVPIPTGAKVLKYGEPIGSATHDIALGEYVHTHNLQSDYLATPAHSNNDGAEA